MSKIKVYVIDDNVDHCNIIHDFFENNPNINIIGNSNDPYEGLAMVKELEPDVVILDNVMPKLDGLGVLQLIQNHCFRTNHPRVIMITSSSTDKFQEEATRLGAAYCMARYMDLSSMEERIKLVIKPPIKLSHLLDSSTSTSREDSLEMNITKMMHEVGVPAHIKGYCYLREAISLVTTDIMKINYITKQLYPEVAKKYCTTSSRVERAIRHAIEIAWNRADTEVLNNLFGYTIDRDRGKPTNGEFIAMISNVIRMKMKIAN